MKYHVIYIYIYIYLYTVCTVTWKKVNTGLTRTVSASIFRDTVTPVVKYQICTVAMDTRIRVARVVVKHYKTEG